MGAHQGGVRARSRLVQRQIGGGCREQLKDHLWLCGKKEKKVSLADRGAFRCWEVGGEKTYRKV